MRFLLTDLNRAQPVDFYLVNLPSSELEERYDKFLPKNQLRLNTRFVRPDPVEAFADSLFGEEFFPEYLGPTSNAPGPADTLIRRVELGIPFPTPLIEEPPVKGSIKIERVTPVAIHLRLDEEDIPVRLPWSALEDAFAISRRLNIKELSTPARSHCDRELGKWIAGLFHAAKLATTWYCVNRWVVSQVGTDVADISASLRSGRDPFPT